MRKLIKGALLAGATTLLPMLASAQTTGGGWNLQNTFNLPGGTVTGIVNNLANWLLVLFVSIGVIGFVISGIWYLVAAGNEDRMQKGKNGMIWSITGVIVGLLGYVVLQAVNTMLGGTQSNF